MESLLLANFNILIGGYAVVKDDIVWKNPYSDDLSDIAPSESKWAVLVPIFPYHRLYLVTEGTASIILSDSSKILLEKNKMYLVPPFMIKSVESSANISHYYLHFKTDPVSINPFDYYNLNNPVEADAEDIKNFSKLLTLYWKNDIHSELLTQGYFSLLLSKFFDTDSQKNAALKRFTPVLKFINENIGESFTNKQLADILGYNETYFSSIFSKTFHVPPLKYALEKKMIFARQQLTRNDLSIRAISESLGFENEYYFNAVFKRMVGVSPGKWRKQFFMQETSLL